MNRINALVRRGQKASLLSFLLSVLPYEDTLRSRQSTPGRGSHQKQNAGILISNFQPPELREKKIVLFISHPGYGTLL